MSMSDDIAAYVAAEIAKRMKVITAVGTVITSPSQVSSDPLTIILDGSALAIQVKQFRGFPVFPGMRVGLIKLGSDWAVIGAFTNPGQGTGTARMVIGADTPPEIRAYGIDVAILSYLTDKTSGLEVGYFFIGTSNRFDGLGDNRVLAFGNVLYPTPGDPSSPTSVDVRTNFQQNMRAPYPQTIFKDQDVQFWTNMKLDGPNSSDPPNIRFEVIDSASALAVRLDGSGVRAGVPSSTTPETWHDFPFANGWAAPAAGTTRLKYRKTAMAEVQIIGSAVSPNPFHNTVGTLPVGYRPVNGQGIFARGASAPDPLMRILSNGVVEAFGSSTIGVTWFFNGTASLEI